MNRLWKTNFLFEFRKSLGTTFTPSFIGRSKWVAAERPICCKYQMGCVRIICSSSVIPFSFPLLAPSWFFPSRFDDCKSIELYLNLKECVISLSIFNFIGKQIMQSFWITLILVMTQLFSKQKDTYSLTLHNFTTHYCLHLHKDRRKFHFIKTS